MPKDTNTLIDESLAKMVALYKSQNVTNVDIISKMNITHYKLNTILSSDEFKGFLVEITDKAVSQAANVWKASISELVHEAKRVLVARLKDDDLEAVKLVIRSLGIEKQETTQQAQNLTVVLPDFNQPKTIEVSDDQEK